MTSAAWLCEEPVVGIDLELVITKKHGCYEKPVKYFFLNWTWKKAQCNFAKTQLATVPYHHGTFDFTMVAS
jgi:hypothetical protein